MSSWRQTFKRMNHEECVGVCVCLWVCRNSTTRNITQTLPTFLLVKSQCFSSVSAWLHYFDFSDCSMSFQKDALLWWGSSVATAKVNPPGPQDYKVPSIYLSCILPGSRAKKDNVTSRSDNMPWYCGPTLIEAAGMATKCPRGEHLPCSPAKRYYSEMFQMFVKTRLNWGVIMIDYAFHVIIF